MIIEPSCPHASNETLTRRGRTNRAASLDAASYGLCNQ
jgi:hypothetical protein